MRLPPDSPKEMTGILEPCALLLTGPYGAGKAALVAEIAGLLEGRVPYAAIDLDWLAWYNDGVTPGHSPAAFEMLVRNLASVVGNYREAAIGHFLLAGAILDDASHERLIGAMGMPIRVVRISAPIAEIERRLASDQRPAVPMTCARRVRGLPRASRSGSKTTRSSPWTRFARWPSRSLSAG